MTVGDPQSVTPEEWMASFVPLGTLDDNNTWTPLGAGVLLLDAPVVWLLTAKSVIEGAGDKPVVAFVKLKDGSATLVDLTTGRTGTDLDWLKHEQLDLAACLFPISEQWAIKAFVETRCFPSGDLQPLLPVCTMSVPYGMASLEAGPKPHVLSGAISAIDAKAGVLHTTAPLLPRNAGAPLFVPLPQQAGGGVALAGIALRTEAVPESMSSTAAPVRLTVSHPISGGLMLIRSEEAKAKRKAALATSS